MRWGAALLVVVVGCTSAKTIRGPDGEAWLAISCGRDQTLCYERAGMECPHGYEVAESDGYAGTALVANRYGAYAGPSYHGSMLVKCRH